MLASVKYWYCPRIASGISMYSMAGGISRAAKTAPIRSFQVRLAPGRFPG